MEGTIPIVVETQKKIWGVTRPVYADHNSETHHASIEPQSWCSKHFHDWKWNLFYVMSGTLLVHYYAEGEDIPSRTFLLKAGESFRVPPRQWHRFQTAKERVELIEIYWTERVVADDIIRADTGGKQPTE